MAATDSDFINLARIFDHYLMILENPHVGKQVTIDNIAQMFKCCSIVETAIAMVRETGKETLLENHLQERWRLQQRSRIYKLSDIEFALDKMLEVCLKDLSIPIKAVDKIVGINAILQSLEELGVSASTLENEALIASWEEEVENGRQEQVTTCIVNMLEDGHISRIIEFLSEFHMNKKLDQLMETCISSKIINNDTTVFLAFIELNTTSLLNLLNNRDKLHISFIDALFYFARNMKYVGNKWISEQEVTYEHILKLMKVFLSDSRKVYDLIKGRLQLAKHQPDCSIWNDIEKDCLQQ
ncbi:uncharacterized protein LOC107266863 isoform X2 [Cephus cinctus]|uniref:Uncharacterized protein LOC107266863 isoform X2 n=1 Tax=Cephus cinctus TaxID=211228 RepID=A0AAJ7FID5_CEPCN|nr:uncharacterized protein LOC107266863 isoform X2 [Cephus cinctus]